MATEKYYGTGRRKSSVARVYVWLVNEIKKLIKGNINNYFVFYH